MPGCSRHLRNRFRLALNAHIVVIKARLPDQPLEQAVKMFLLIDGMIIVTMIFVLAFLIAVIPEINFDSLPIPHSPVSQMVHSCKHLIRRIEICSLHITYVLAVLDAVMMCRALEPVSERADGGYQRRERRRKNKFNHNPAPKKAHTRTLLVIFPSMYPPPLRMGSMCGVGTWGYVYVSPHDPVTGTCIKSVQTIQMCPIYIYIYIYICFSRNLSILPLTSLRQAGGAQVAGAA